MTKLIKSFILLLSFVLILVACGAKDIPNRKNWAVESFSYTDQNENTVTLEQLKGEVWIADFVFTNCIDVCPPMTRNMKKVQDRLKEENLDVKIVSFTVDPEFDTPQVLANYAETYKADQSSWYFLTGYTQKHIEQFALKSFKALVSKPADSDLVIHGTDFYLIDKTGTIAQYYSGLNDIPVETIIEHAKILVRE
ncbi:SCO family protein [Bacillus sp. HMF5848]|uniref:SCO family protein n=1 Tax=Bacillus sp. HMF5848 TaxID=2495421 RepID=UPI000F7A5769|nr:SCO family protein [Bacillus sp. HMF5848]RSK27285.1 SCO family protein [Bacillus sp. HMF5848]